MPYYVRFDCDFCIECDKPEEAAALADVYIEKERPDPPNVALLAAVKTLLKCDNDDDLFTILDDLDEVVKAIEESPDLPYNKHPDLRRAQRGPRSVPKTKQERRRHRLREAGLCTICCGERLKGFMLCGSCREKRIQIKANARERKRREAEGQQQDEPEEHPETEPFVDVPSTLEITQDNPVSAADGGAKVSAQTATTQEVAEPIVTTDTSYTQVHTPLRKPVTVEQQPARRRGRPPKNRAVETSTVLSESTVTKVADAIAAELVASNRPLTIPALVSRTHYSRELVAQAIEDKRFSHKYGGAYELAEAEW